MIGITLSFSIYFSYVENNVDAQKAIQDNIGVIPVVQILAYEGYFAYVLMGWIRNYQQGGYEKITKSNAVLVSGRIFHGYVTAMVDLISITVIMLTFFSVGYGMGGEDAQNVRFWADLCFLTVLPYLGFFSYLPFRKK